MFPSWFYDTHTFVMTATPPNRLQRLREAAGLSFEEVAVEFGVSKETVQYWERTSIPAKWLRPLARHFKVSVDFLLGDGDHEPEKAAA